MKIKTILLTGLFSILSLVSFSFFSCQSKGNSADNKETTKTLADTMPSFLFEGQWKCPEKNWKVVITKVDETTYNLKWWYNIPSDTMDEKASGTYDYDSRTNVLTHGNYLFKFANDGRLYETSQAVFFTE